MPDRFRTVRINLIEQKGWWPWREASVLAERAHDAALEKFHDMPLGVVRDLVEDLIGNAPLGWAGPKEWSPRQATSTEFQEIAREVKEGTDERFEGTRFAIMDAMTWMYQEAMTPNSGDIRDAMTRTVDHLGGDYNLDHELWEPILGTKSGEWWSESAILRTLMNQVDFIHDRGNYDRYLVFSFGGSATVLMLTKKSPWPKKLIDGRLKEEFARLRRDYLEYFFYFLEREMKEVDVDGRIRWDVRWKELMTSPGFVNDARNKIRKALRTLRGGR